MIRVFMDSSALFAAVMSPSGASRELIRLAVNEEIRLIISEDVVIETHRNLDRKAADLEPLLAKLLEVVDFEIVPDPSREDVWSAEEYVAQNDAFIIAAAINANVDFVATFDRKHLIDPPEVGTKSGLNITTPGDILTHVTR
jgi:predicted nucleic acid-binding protein